MKRLFLTTAILAAFTAPGLAAIHDLSISGSLGGNPYTGELSLDVSGNEIVSGTGTLSILGLDNAPLVLITSSTPYASGYPDGLGFRSNGGTDYWGLDQAFPISTNGLLFDVGTTTAEWGQHPLFAIWSDGEGGYASAFTGGVNGVGYYDLRGNATASAGAVPEPSTWAMLGLGFAGLGLAGWKRSRTNRVAVAI